MTSHRSADATFTLSGSETPLSHLFGSGEPFDAETVDRLYPGGAREYLQRFTTSLDAAIRAGFILAADRDEILALASTTYPSSPD